MLKTFYIEKINLHLFDGRKKISDFFPIGLEAKFNEMLKESLKSEAKGDNKAINKAELSYTPDEGVDNMSERDYNNYG